MNALSTQDIYEFITDLYNKKSKEVVGSEDEENVISIESVSKSESWKYIQEVPRYSISRIYERVQACGDVEITPKPVFDMTFTSTTYCIPSDQWEYLYNQDCDNRRNEFGTMNCTLRIKFGTDVGNFKPSLLHRLGLSVANLVIGLDHNFGFVLSPSNTTKQYWSDVNPAVWNLKVNGTIDVTTKPQYSTRFYQLVGRCAEYKVYTNIIKPVKIPGLQFCKKHDEFLPLARYEMSKNSGTLPGFNYVYYLHPIGIDFVSREDDVFGLKLNHVYDELCFEVRRAFNITSLDKGENINHVEKWTTYSERYTKCPWRLTDLVEGCGIKLERVHVVLSLEKFTAKQLVGSCGEINIYTDYILSQTIPFKI
jgi:hypothetical protein